MLGRPLALFKESTHFVSTCLILFFFILFVYVQHFVKPGFMLTCCINKADLVWTCGFI